MSGAIPPDFGTDLSCTLDLTDDAAEVSGITVLAEALFRRLYTPRGALWQDPHYGLDLRLYMSITLTPSARAALIRDVGAELKKDERVDAVSVVVVSSTLFEIVLAITVTTATGPFSLTIQVTQAAVTLVSVDPGGV